MTLYEAALFRRQEEIARQVMLQVDKEIARILTAHGFKVEYQIQDMTVWGKESADARKTAGGNREPSVEGRT